MARRFPAHTLNLRYTNIDLAGRRTSAPQGLGVAPSSTQPRLAFDYVLQNPSGRVIALQELVVEVAKRERVEG